MNCVPLPRSQRGVCGRNEVINFINLVLKVLAYVADPIPYWGKSAIKRILGHLS